ncbi:MAG: epoxyqueuosine reductase QueH [Clostridia bacterium]|nr:epoxyqueuosine reductase QueH [Clostridia bacterium]
MKKLLMHTCCAPCFVYIQKDISENGILNSDGVNEPIDLTAFWCNPNIHPQFEYTRRKNTFINFCKDVECNYIVSDDYDLNAFVTDIVNKVGSGEFNIRCEYCYLTRLEKAFEYAKNNGYDMVGTTLSISPYQNHLVLKNVLEKLSKKYNIEYMYKDYRSNYREGQNLARQLELYRQKYCGCIFSMDERKVGILMKKYSKTKLKVKRIIPVIITILSVLLILSLVLVIYINSKGSIIIQKVDENAKNVSNDTAKKSLPIVVNNIIVGAVYEKKWISAEKYYFNSTGKQNTEVDVYNKTGKAGTFKLNEMKQNSDYSMYTSTTSLNKADEYFAIGKTSNIVMLQPIRKSTVTEKDKNDVKKALGIYSLFNSTVKINEIYDVSLNNNEQGKIISATNSTKNIFGVYSIIFYISNTGKIQIIKYNYVKNTKNASDWPIYSLKFVADLNNDGMNEAIIQEITEFNVKYDIIEYRTKGFYEVLSSNLKI